MSNWTARLHLAAGLLAQAGGAALVMFGGNVREPWMVVTGGIVGAAGLVLWGRGAHARGRLEAEQEAEALSRSTARGDQLVLELQQQVTLLRAEQELLRRAPWPAAPDGAARGSAVAALPPAERRGRTGTTPLPPQ